MNKYIIGIREVWINQVEVYADNEDDAMDKAENTEPENSEDLEYSHTLERSTWSIRRHGALDDKKRREIICMMERRMENMFNKGLSEEEIERRVLELQAIMDAESKYG